MTHWYREPKRVKLMEHLDRTGISFVLCCDEFSNNDLLNLKTVLPPLALAEKLTLGTPTSGDRGKVLIIAPHESSDHRLLHSPEPWAGIFVLPAQGSQREQALRTFLASNRSFQNGARGCRVLSKGVLHPFVLDLRTFPPSLHGVREAHADSVSGQ